MEDLAGVDREVQFLVEIGKFANSQQLLGLS